MSTHGIYAIRSTTRTMIIIVSQSAADKQIVCITQPATAGRHRRSGARQSIPELWAKVGDGVKG